MGRMESTSKMSKIQVCDLTADLLHVRFRLEERRDSKERVGIMVKGKGWKETWWLTGLLVVDSGKTEVKAHNKYYSKTSCEVPTSLELAILSAEKEVCPSSAGAPVIQNWEILGQDLYHFPSGESGSIERVVTVLEHRLLDLVSSRTGSTIKVLPMEVSQELSSFIIKISSL